MVKDSAFALLGLILQKAQSGHHIRFYCGTGREQDKVNIKFTIEPSHSTSAGSLSIISFLLHQLKALLSKCHVVAHAHDHSGGRSVVTFNLWDNPSAEVVEPEVTTGVCRR